MVAASITGRGARDGETTIKPAHVEPVRNPGQESGRDLRARARMAPQANMSGRTGHAARYVRRYCSWSRMIGAIAVNAVAELQGCG